jgi:hypothetical protein
VNTYDAIMKAADQIESDPGIWDYWVTHVPPCGSPGCAIGLIAQAMGVRPYTYVDSDTVTRVLGVSSMAFYERMCELSKAISGGCMWTDAGRVPAVLRAYARRYHERNFAQEAYAQALALVSDPVSKEHT